MNIEKAKKNSVDFRVAFMIKLRNAAVHRPLQAKELFEKELYGVSACFSVDRIDEMCHDKKLSIQDRLQWGQSPSPNPHNSKVLIIKASSLLRKLSNVIFDHFCEFTVIFCHHVVQSAKDCKKLDVTA